MECCPLSLPCPSQLLGLLLFHPSLSATPRVDTLLPPTRQARKLRKKGVRPPAHSWEDREVRTQTGKTCHMASLTPSAQPSQGRMLWTEWQKGFVGQSLLLWEADDSSQGPASVPAPPPLCPLELKSRDFSAPPSDSDSKTGDVLALVHPAQPEAGCSAHFGRKKKRGLASRMSPGYHHPHLAGETTLGGPRREGERPGGWAPLAGPPFSPHLADGSAGLLAPVSPSRRGGWHQPPAIACPSRLIWHQSVRRVQTQQDKAAAGPQVPPLCAWLT